MEKRNVFLSVITALILLLVLVIPQSVFATTATTPKYLGITELRTNDTPNFGYAIGDPNTNGATGRAAKIWNILEYTGEGNNASLKADGSKNIYCVKAGVGFSDTRKRATYNEYYDDMKTKRDEIKAQNDVLNSIVEGTVPYSEGTVSKYNALLALGDMLYFIGDSTEDEKTTLLSSAGIDINDYSVLLTDDDIAAVQQAAIWYFTNYGEENGKYDKTLDTAWLNYTTDGDSYTSLSDYKLHNGNDGIQRQEQAEILYKYLINTAKANANNYSDTKQGEETTDNSTAPAKLVTTKLNYTMRDGKYIVGPILINAVEGNTMPYDIDFSVNKTFKLLNSNKQEVDEGKTVKDLVGQDFYISVSDIDDIKVTVDVKYANNKLVLWASTTNNQEQPVMIPEKNIESKPITLTLESKTFDLALRKYITKLTSNGVTKVLSSTSDTTRVPNIEESTLTSGTTATYKHRKDPVSVETGDIVTYNITIYNEGDKAGRATQVIDQLPTGLKFKRVVSGSFDADSTYSETGNNKLILNRKANNTDNLSAYSTGHLSSETIEIECEVIATPDAKNKKTLTNVAWIASEYDAETNTEIYNQDGLDRDSKPATHPSVDKDSMSDYKGKSTNKSTLDDKDYHYEGEQDDDDFEKLVLNPKEFDLRLKKYISAINGDTSKGKTITSIDTTELANKTSTDAEFDLSKNVVSVKHGDYVTYTFRVYNEGDINGYVTKLTDNIPLGLQFVQAKNDGKTITIYSYSAENGITSEDKEVDSATYGLINRNNAQWTIDREGTSVKTDTYDGDTTPSISLDVEGYLGGTNTLLEAYDASKDPDRNGASLKSIETTVVLRVSEQAELNKVLRNEAAITGHKDENGNEAIVDRDSQPENWPGKDDHSKYQDDEDYDNIILGTFDLALRKQITSIYNTFNKKETKYNDRYAKLDKTQNNTIYNYYDVDANIPTVVENDIVTYSIRVYNEGKVDGTATWVTDRLPSGLQYLPDDETNKEYGWKAFKQSTASVEKAIKIGEKYYEEVAFDSNEIYMYATDHLKDTTIKAYTGDGEATYGEVFMTVRVKAKTEVANGVEYKLRNIAEIGDDNNEDEDSTPGDESKWKDQDDVDVEDLKLVEFDLALRKWVTQAIVYDNNGQTVTETGHQPYDDPEQVVKVELHRKKLNQVTVKFKYSIRVINEGDIAGYAKEVTDYIPQGLKFVAEDNPGWTDEGNNVVSTRLLEGTLLQPGEYADVEILLTWVNNENNMGVMVNTAEISEDYNEYGVPDRDSIPDNKKPGEDDIDDAPVMLSISTGQMRIYFVLGFVVLITIAGGVVLIKKYVL